MKIAIIASADADRSTGVGGVCCYLAEAFRRIGQTADLISNETLVPRLKRNLRQFAFALALTFYRPAYGYDVLDIGAGDGMFIAFILKIFKPRNRPLLVARSHGLEHVANDAIRSEAAAGRIKLSWKYPIYHGGYRLWQVKQYLRMADLVLLLNDFDRHYAIKRLGVDASRANVVENAIPDMFLGRSIGFQAPAILRVALIGGFQDRKGIAFSVPALGRLLRTNQNLEVSFLGAQVDAVTILAGFPAETKDRVRIVERYRHDDLPQLLQDHHVLLFPSLSEGFPLAPLEAMACGLAPIVTDIPGIAERLRNGQNSLIIPVRDQAAIETSVQHLIDNPVALEAMRRSAYQFAQSYSWTKRAKEMIELYQCYKTSAVAAAG
jgi:glycosyltransferase involved in cell wall biosynthesis